MQTLSLVLIVAAAALAVGGLAAWRAYRLGQQRARRVAAELTILNEIGRDLLRAELDLDALSERVFVQASRIITAPSFQLGLFEGDAYLIKVWMRDGQLVPGQVFPDAGQRGLVGWVRRTGQPLLVKDFEAERDSLPAFPQSEHQAPPRSGLFVPLIAGNDTIGIIAVQSHQPGCFTEEHLRLLTGLANQAAWAIRNAQLYERARHRADQLRLVGRVSAQMSRIQPLADLFREIVTRVSEAFGYYCVSIFVVEGDEIRPGASTRDLLRELPRVAQGQGMIGWAAQQGLTALANNVAEDPRYRHWGILPETRSEIALPLKVEERVLGVLDVQSDQVGAFQEEEVHLLETLAAQAAVAIEQTQTYEAERRLSQRLEALVRASQTIVSVLDMDDLLDQIVELIAETFEFDRVHIFVRIGDRLVFRAGTGPHSVRWLIEELSYALDDAGLIPKVARTLEPELVADVEQSSDYVPGPSVEDTRSEMTVPIHMAGIAMGVIDLQSQRIGAFSDEDVVLMQSLADSVAVALRNAVLYASERRRRSLADTLREVSARLASKLDLDSVLADILEGLRRVIALQTAALLLFEENEEVLTVLATTGPNLEGFVGQRLPLDVLRNVDGLSVLESLRRVYRELLQLPADRDLLVEPLAVGGDVIGYIITDQPEPYTPIDLEILSAFANQAAVAVSNARLYAAQQAEAYVTTALLQVAEAVNAQVQESEALEMISRLTALLAGVSRCLILRWDADERAYYVSAQYGIAREPFIGLLGVPIRAEEHPLLDLLSVADRPLGAGAQYQLPTPEPLARLLPASAIMCFPLRARGGLVGLLVVDEPRRSTNPRLISVLTGIAHQTATVLETANLQASAVERERLEQELEVARSIQASFIPDAPPQLPGWQVAAAWEAARQVSGDFYDFIPLPNGNWGLVIADVADKGMPAALFMAVCRTLLRAAAISRVSPAATLMRVNQLLFNDARTDLFVTVFYAVWDPLTGRVAYSSGGHNAALFVRAQDSRVSELTCRGIALGVISDITLEEHEVILQPGDMLVAYTDGVTEATRTGYEQFGLERFKAVLEASGTRDAADALQQVLQTVSEFVGGAPQSDDLTLWMLKRDR
jgi:serine phosphatase RsbU (regulator of sigma subunit)/putative methionine-R-sulfoxide reductase with GAF domain